MNLKFDKGERPNYIDRTGTVHESGGPEGFYISFKDGQFSMEWDDENDAIYLAQRIMERMGETWPKEKS